MTRQRIAIISAVGALGLGVVAVSAQQPPAAAAGQAGAQAPAGRGRGAPTAPPPINWPSPPLADAPIVMDTALVRPIAIIATKGLDQPWSMAFLAGWRILVTERGGTLRIVRNGVLDPTPVERFAGGHSGAGACGADGRPAPSEVRGEQARLHHVPQEAAARRRPACRRRPPDRSDGRGPLPPAGVITLARGRWDGTKLVDVKDIFTAIPTRQRVAHRLRPRRDDLHVGRLRRSAAGESGQSESGHMPPQDPNNLAGKRSG